MARAEHKTPSESAAKPSHPDHPRWALETLVEDEAKWRRSAGLECSDEAIRREWRQSLERVDAKQRDLQRRRRPASKPDRAAPVARELGYQFWAGERVEREAKRQYQKALRQQSPRERKLTARIKALMAHRRNPTTGKVERLFPSIADEIALEGFLCVQKRGPYRDKTKAERNAIAQRRLEDIADRSVRWLGEWL